MTSKLVVGTILATIFLATVAPMAANAAGFAAEASISPDIQYLNDTTGTLYTVSVRNTGTLRSIGAVQIRRPSSAWKIVSCPDAPTGWTKSQTIRRCRYFSAPGPGDNIQPGQTRTFTLRAKTLPGDRDVSGAWRVKVSRTNSFGDLTAVRLAAPMAPGLTTKIFSFQILSAVVASGPATPGAPCPAPNNTAIAGSSGHALVICGRNRTIDTRTPKADQAVLEGTFIASHGSFSSGPVAPTASSRVLGNWADVTITGAAGGDKTVVAKVGASSIRRSPRTTLAGFTALTAGPVITTSAGSTAYTEGGPATTVDGALTITDGDDTNLESGQVRISAGFQAGDDLVFVNQNGISGVYNTGTGVLTLTGTSSIANYQTALRSIQFQTTSDNPGASRTVEFKVNDGDNDSNLATRTIAITPADDAPTAVNDSATVAEDAGASALAVLANDTDPDGGPKTISSASDPANGTVVLTGGSPGAHTGLTYQPDPNYCNDPPGISPDTFTYTLNGGSTATVSVTVTCAADVPVVATSAGSTAYTEGDPATTIDGALTVTDGDDFNLESGQVRISSGFQAGDDLVFVNQNGISGVYNTGTGVLTLTGTSSVANYQTALRSIAFQTTNDNPSTSKTVEFKVNDGDNDSNLATKTIAITPVNDAPTVDTTDSALTYTEGDGAVAVDNGITVSDPDSANIQGATVQITSNFVGAEDELAFTNQLGITGSYNDATGVLTLSGTALVADYRSALRSVTYTNSGTGISGSRTISFQVTDSNGATSNAATRTINLGPTNAAPVITTSAGDTAYTEGGAATTIDGALTVTDADGTNLEGGQVRISSGFQAGDDLVFVNQNGISGVYNTGTGVLTLTGTSSIANYQTALRSIAFQTSNDNPSTSRTVEFKVNDGTTDSNLATKGIAVTPVNDAPALASVEGTSLVYTEGDATMAISAAITVADFDSSNLAGATVQITAGYQNGQDVLSLGTNPQNGITGTFNAATGTLTLSGASSLANYQAALRDVRYTNTSDNPSTAIRTVSFQVTDDGAAASNAVSRNITVVPVNDAPSLAGIEVSALAYIENDPPTSITSTVTVTDPDSNIAGAAITIGTNFASLEDVLSFTNQLGITGSYNSGTGVLTLTGTASVADYQTALRAVKFSNTSEDPSTLTRNIDFQVQDAGSALSNVVDRDVTVTAVNDAPIGVADSYGNAVGNTLAALGTTGSGPHIVLTGSVVTANDTDAEGDSITAVAEIVGSTGGGTATINADGSFTFLPGVGDKNQVDTFTYRVTDGLAQGSGTVSITIANVLVWYVDDSLGAGDGRSISPLNSLTGINGAGGSGDSDGTGDIIFLYSGTYSGGLALEVNQKLTGQPHGLTVNPGSGNVTLVAAGGTNPTIGNTGGAGIALANGVEIQRVNVNGTSGAGVTGSAITNATIGGNTSIGGATGNAFELSGAASGTIDVGSTISSSTARSISVQNRSGGSVNFTANVTDTGQGILLNSNTGATISLTGSLTISSGTNAGFTATAGGTVSANNAANTIATTTGTALNVTNTTIGAADLTFLSISSNGAANGILLNNTGASGNLTVTGNGGTCTSAATCTGGAIQNATVGISLISTMGPSFDQMGIFNTSGHGVGGTDVSSFTFTDGRIENSGTGGGVDTSNIAFDTVASGTENNLDGVVTITGNALTNARYHGIDIFNFSGLITDANISNNTITSSDSVVASLGDGIRWITRGGAGNAADVTKATLNNNVINNFPSGVGLQVQCGNASSEAAQAADCGTAGHTTNVINITNNKINGNGLGSTVRTGAEGMIALVNGVGQGNFNITDNEVRQNTGTSISSSAFGDAVVTETISNNTIVSNNTVGSQGIGIGTSTTGGFATNTPSLTATISGNNVSQTDGNGILTVARDSSAGLLNVKVLNNTVAAPLAGVRQGIRIDAGNATGDNDVCLQIQGNTSAGSAVGAMGIGLRKQGTSTTVNAFGIVGLSPSPATGPQVIVFVTGQNPSGGGTLLISSQDGFTSCPAF